MSSITAELAESDTNKDVTSNLDWELPDQAAPTCTINSFKAADNPIIAAGRFVQATINVSTNSSCNWDLRVNDSAGTLLTSGSGSGSATATHVTNGTKFYLQPKGDTNYVDNLAVLSATVAAQAPSACTVSVFTVTPVQADSEFGVVPSAPTPPVPTRSTSAAPTADSLPPAPASPPPRPAIGYNSACCSSCKRRVTPQRAEPSPARLPLSFHSRGQLSTRSASWP